MNKFLRKIFKNQQGQVFILFVFMFIMLCCFLGLVIDVWQLTYNKQKLQDGIDFAALSAAQQISVNDEQVVSTAIHIANKNGIHSNELTVTHPYNGDDNKIELSATRTIDYLFFPILGIKNKTIAVRSVAEAQYEVLTNEIFGYGIFSGDKDEIFELSGSNNIFDCDIHINSKLKLSGSNNFFNKKFECIGYEQLDSNNYYPHLNTKAKIVPMITLDIEEFKQKATKVYKKTVNFSSTLTLDGIIYVDGDVIISASNVSGRGTIVATGNIIISGDSINYSSENDMVALYSGKDFIEIAGSNAVYKGIFYVPNGKIKLNGSNNIFKGSLVANSFENLSSSNSHFIYDPKVKELIGDRKITVKLIE